MLAQDPAWAIAHAFTGHAHYFAGKDDAAIRYLEEAIRLNPNIGVQ